MSRSCDRPINSAGASGGQQRKGHSASGARPVLDEFSDDGVRRRQVNAGALHPPPAHLFGDLVGRAAGIADDLHVVALFQRADRWRNHADIGREPHAEQTKRRRGHPPIRPWKRGHSSHPARRNDGIAGARTAEECPGCSHAVRLRSHLEHAPLQSGRQRLSCRYISSHAVATRSRQGAEYRGRGAPDRRTCSART